MKNQLIIILILFYNCLFAQTKIDSLEAILPNKIGLEKAHLLNNLAFTYWNISPDKGLYYANMAYSISLKEDSKADIAESLQNIGINYWAKSELHLALENYQQSLKIYEEIKNIKGISMIYSNMGIIYRGLSDYKTALKYYLKALEISKKKGFTSLYISTTSNISAIYLAQQNYQKALEFVQEAIVLSSKQSDTINLVAHLNTMGQIYSIQKNYKKAKSTYQKALLLNKKNRNNFGTAIVLYNIGNTEYNLKNYDSALEYYQKALILSVKINDQIGVLLVNKQIGLIYKEQHKFNSAFSYYKKSIDLAIKLDLKEEKLNIYKSYSELYKSIGKFDKSVDYLEKFISLKDSIYNENSSKQIAEMQTKYDSAKKEIELLRNKEEIELLRNKEEILNLEITKQTNLRNSFIGISILVLLLIIILLNRIIIKKKANKLLVLKNEVILNQRNELKEINATKDKFFTIISHDLRSPFNSILGFTDLLNKKYDSIDDIQKKDIILSLSKSSKSAYKLLDNLLTWSRTQAGKIIINKEVLNLKELVETSIAPYKENASKKNIEIATNVPPDAKILIDRNTSMIIIENLFNNALKFTPEGGTITINYHENEDTIELHIIDTGVGMSLEVIGKLFNIGEDISTEGTNNEKGTGLGLIICKEFINKNGGNISVKSEVGKGSQFIITFFK